MSSVNLTSILRFLSLFFFLAAPIWSQLSLASPLQADPSTTDTLSSSPTQTEESYPICATGGGEWMMDPPTAIRLSALFCQDLYLPGNFPDPGSSFHSAHYPTELTPEPNSPNYTAIEATGIVANMWFGRSASLTLDNGTFVPLGTSEQCARDNCTTALRDAITACEFNSHYVGGDTMVESECGFYALSVANCSGDWIDDTLCGRWHVMYPGVGASREEATPSTTYTYHGDDEVATATTNALAAIQSDILQT